MPSLLWPAALNGPACNAGNNFWNASSSQLPEDVAIGSLVDGKANMLSPQSFNAGYATDSGIGATSSSPVAFQFGFAPLACGPGLTNF